MISDILLLRRSSCCAFTLASICVRASAALSLLGVTVRTRLGLGLLVISIGTGSGLASIAIMVGFIEARALKDDSGGE